MLSKRYLLCVSFQLSWGYFQGFRSKKKELTAVGIEPGAIAPQAAHSSAELQRRLQECGVIKGVLSPPHRLELSLHAQLNSQLQFLLKQRGSVFGFFFSLGTITGT